MNERSAMSFLLIAPLTWQCLRDVMHGMTQISGISILIAAASSLLANEKPASLPPPVSDKIYTFQQIETQKTQLKDKVVRIEIKLLLGEPSDLLGNGTQRYIAKDTSNGATPYGQIAFPREGLEKMGLANDPHREGPYTVYARVHVFSEKKAAAICVAVGTQVAVENGKATYSW